MHIVDARLCFSAEVAHFIRLCETHKTFCAAFIKAASPVFKPLPPPSGPTLLTPPTSRRPRSLLAHSEEKCWPTAGGAASQAKLSALLKMQNLN